jgi:guanine nucleotide-binding protein G(o) subunit alpha
MSKLGIEFDEENRSNREQDIKRVMFFFENRQDKDSIDAELAANIKSLWEDPAIQQCFNRANEFQLNDSAHYYLDQVDRITGADYLPTEQDILRARVQTTGIVEIRFPNSEFMFRVFDVGGQRSERRKWIHCFENVTSIIFITAISEYDQVLLEDASTNRMHESLTLFDNIFNNRYFVKTSFILFLNKIDVFEEKIKHSLIKACFPEYDEPNEFEPGIKFIEHKFKSVNVTNVKEIYCHPTCATDTQNVQFVLAAVNDIIVQGNLATTGLY